MPWDFSKLKNDIRNDTMNLRQIKGDLRRPGYQMSSVDALGLKEAKADATIRHAIAAHLNGHIHICYWLEKEKKYKISTKDEQYEFIKDNLPRYALPEEPESTQEAATA